MTGRFKSLGDSLGPLVADLERRARDVQDLGHRVRAVLPGPEREHFLGATYRGETLVISMDSAAWCSRIRYDQETLIQALHAAGETKVTKIKVRVGKR
jgi:hypothetical protein